MKKLEQRVKHFRGNTFEIWVQYGNKENQKKNKTKQNPETPQSKKFFNF